jgi:hypothetical protein
MDIREWSMDQIKLREKHCPRIVFIGKTDTGKTTLVKDFLYHNQDIPFVTVISTTERFNRNYTGIVPDMFIHNYNKDIIKKYIERQEFITEKCESNPEYAEEDPRSILIFDDCLHKIRNWAYDEDIQSLFFVGRQINCCVVLTMQHPMGITPDLRTNVDYVFLGYESLHTNKKKLFDHYAGVFDDYGLFCAALDSCTENYGWLVIDHKVRSHKLEDKVFWYRAPEKPKKFRLCDDHFWETPIKEQIVARDEHYITRRRDYHIRRLASREKEEKDVKEYNPTIPKRY